MTITTIITDALQAIPPWMRKTLLIVFALVIVAETVLRIFEVGLPYDKIDQVLVYVGGYLGVQSAANVKPKGGEHRAAA